MKGTESGEWNYATEMKYRRTDWSKTQQPDMTSKNAFEQTNCSGVHR